MFLSNILIGTFLKKKKKKVLIAQHHNLYIPDFILLGPVYCTDVGDKVAPTNLKWNNII